MTKVYKNGTNKKYCEVIYKRTTNKLWTGHKYSNMINKMIDKT